MPISQSALAFLVTGLLLGPASWAFTVEGGPRPPFGSLPAKPRLTPPCVASATQLPAAVSVSQAKSAFQSKDVFIRQNGPALPPLPPLAGQAQGVNPFFSGSSSRASSRSEDRPDSAARAAPPSERGGFTLTVDTSRWAALLGGGSDRRGLGNRSRSESPMSSVSSFHPSPTASVKSVRTVSSPSAVSERSQLGHSYRGSSLATRSRASSSSASPLDAQALARARRVGPRAASSRPKYVVMSIGPEAADWTPEQFKMAETILKHMPKGMKGLMFGVNEDVLRRFDVFVKKNRLDLYPTERARAWVQDYFPESVMDERGRHRWTRFRYAAPPDDDFSARLKQMFPDSEAYDSPLHAEGGNLLYDDKNRLFMTDRVLADNDHLTAKQVDAELKRALLVDSVHFFPTLPGDRTGHLDMMALYAGKNRMIVGDSKDPKRKEVLDVVAAKFRELGFKVTRIMNGDNPKGRVIPPDQVLSYTNALLLENQAFVPAYYDPKYQPATAAERREQAILRARDQKAIKQYQSMGFEVHPIQMTTSICEGKGAVHCLSKVIPRMPSVRYRP
jgi:agmatine/peptidylarginine deiminase